MSDDDAPTVGSDEGNRRMAAMFCREPLVTLANEVINRAKSEGRDLTDAEAFSLQGWIAVVKELDKVVEQMWDGFARLQEVRAQAQEQLRLFATDAVGEKVYFQSDGEFIKIGRTIRAEHKRRKENQTGNARPLTTLAVIPGASEAKLMARFKMHHVRGEWYRMAPEIMEFIRAWQLIEAAFP